MREHNARRVAVVLASLSVALASPVIRAQEQPATTPATTTSAAESMVAVVEAVEGRVQVRKTKDAAWEPAVVGMELREGSEIRTGLRSAIRCTIPPGQTFVLDRMTTIELSQAVREGGKVKTDLTMKYGRTQYEVQRAGVDHEAAISSPGATLAVRGTIVELENTPPFRPRATSYTGAASFESQRRRSAIGSTGGRRADAVAGQSTAETALLRSIVDPQYSPSRTSNDNRVIAQQTSRGGVARFDARAGIPFVVDGPGPVGREADLVASLPGQFNVVTRWSGNADVNFTLVRDSRDPNKSTINPDNPLQFRADEYLFPGFGFNTTASGGRIDFDDRGGPRGGQEIAYWNKPAPTGTYSLDIVLERGRSADVTINAFNNGSKLPMFAFFTGDYPDVTPPLSITSIPIDETTTITFADGKSTTFRFALRAEEGKGRATVQFYVPLDPDSNLGQQVDLNANAPADLPGTTGTPTTAGLSTSAATLNASRRTSTLSTGSAAPRLRTDPRIGIGSPRVGPALGPVVPSPAIGGTPSIRSGSGLSAGNGKAPEAGPRR